MLISASHKEILAWAARMLDAEPTGKAEPKAEQPGSAQNKTLRLKHARSSKRG